MITLLIVILFTFFQTSTNATAQGDLGLLGLEDIAVSQESDTMAPSAPDKSPFDVEINAMEDGFSVKVSIPEGHHLYKEYFKVTLFDGTIVNPVKPIEEELIKDPFTEEDKIVFNKNFVAEYLFPANAPTNSVKVDYQGCSQKICYMPQAVEKVFSATTTATEQTIQKNSNGDEWKNIADTFTIKAQEFGSMDKKQFLAFLDKATTGEEIKEESFLDKYGITLTLLFVLLGGIALNLTPCVLPMIPINLAIIGAGVKAGNKTQGFVLGGIYGLGIAIAYGMLGVLVVIAGSTFGTLNAAPWFNFATAIIFIVLALAMFDIITIDFSRFQSGRRLNAKKTGVIRFIVIFLLGAFSALLAGACVAPVLITVLLISANLYSTGNYAGLLLPFLLGIGMGLPWPIAGAGIAALPKPGMWMTRIKQCFGVLILLFAAYYAYEGWLHLNHSSEVTQLEQASQNATLSIDNNSLAFQLEAGLKEAQQSGKPVFLDFWATWCKSCMYMEKTTFNDEEIKARLQKDFVTIRLQAERPSDPQIKEVLDYYNIKGLPACFVLDSKH